jgi:hypothetical protein
VRRQSVFEDRHQIHARRGDHGALLLLQDVFENPALQFLVKGDAGTQPASGRKPGEAGARTALAPRRRGVGSR